MRIILLGIACLLNFAAYSQRPSGASGNRGEAMDDGPYVVGMVLNQNQEALPYASVTIYSSVDSTIVEGAASNDQGRFRIKVKDGSYYMIVSFLSFQEKRIGGITIQGGKNHFAGRIILTSSEEFIDEVVIVEKKSEVQLHLDKKVFIVGSDISNTGGNAADILQNVPSVEVDVEGNVSLRGSENVRILIDGKPSGLTGIGSTDGLRHLQGNMIEKVEVITNPSAKFDAEGEVGIINLVLKKDKREGFNGSFELGAGYHHNYSASFNLNYRKEKYNLFTSYGVNYRESPGSGFSEQRFSYPDTSFAYNTDREHTRGGMGTNLRVGTDIYLNPKSTLTGSMLYSYSKGDNEAKVVYTDLDEVGNIIFTTERLDNEEEIKQDIEFDVRYEKKFAKKDQIFTADFKWSQGDDTEKSDIEETSDKSSTVLIQRASNIEDQRNYLIQADYVHPIGANGKIETGVKTTIRRIINDFLVEEQDQGQNWAALPDFDNEFRYDENIYAAYLMYANKTGNFNYQLGLRSELSDLLTDLIESNEVNDRSYIDWFPSAHFSYELPKQHTLQLSYSRRLSRPHFRYLLPFFSYSNSRNFFSGNPNLEPEYTNSIEVGYLKRFEKGSLLMSVYYRNRQQVTQRFTVADSFGNTTMFPINAGTENDIGIESNLMYQITDWWRFSVFANFYHFDLDGEYEGQVLNSEDNTFRLRGSSNFNIRKKLDVQTSVSYRAPRENVQGKYKGSYSWDLGASMDIIKGNGTLTLSGRDIMNSRKRRSTTVGNNFETTSEFQWRSRQINLTFIYRINQKKKRSYNRGGMDGMDDF